MAMEASKTRIELERDEYGRLLPGQQSLNPLGRPKGKTLKEYGREFFTLMTDDEKRAYLIALEEARPGFAWAMIEGNPTEDKNIKISVPKPILGGTTQADTAYLSPVEGQKALEAAVVEEINDTTHEEPTT